MINLGQVLLFKGKDRGLFLLQLRPGLVDSGSILLRACGGILLS